MTVVFLIPSPSPAVLPHPRPYIEGTAQADTIFYARLAPRIKPKIIHEYTPPSNAMPQDPPPGEIIWRGEHVNFNVEMGDACLLYIVSLDANVRAWKCAYETSGCTSPTRGSPSHRFTVARYRDRC